MQLDELETPVPVVDLDILRANILRLQAYFDEHKIANRPHIKTHKIPEIAQMQVDAGAVGITCQKLSEAEVMAAAGLRDIFLPYNIIGTTKLSRLMALAAKVTLSVTADSAFVARGLSGAAHAAGLTLPVLVECDTGGQRCGVQTPEAAAELARLIASLPGLHFGGLMTYPNDASLGEFVRATRALLAADGLTVERVSGGGTPTMWDVHHIPEITEHRAGIYVYGDRLSLRSGAVRPEDCSFRVLTTVISRPTSERGIVDAGSKSLSSDLHDLEGYGLICEYPEAKLYRLTEEHGHIDFSACAQKPEIGERLSIIPNHCCMVSNAFDQVAGVRGGQVEVVWKVAARGTVI